MANTFKNSFAKNVGTTPVTVYTAPASTQVTVIGMTVANTTLSAIAFDIMVTSSSVDYYLAKNVPIATGGAIVPVGGDQKVVLEAGDAIKVRSSVTSGADVVLSVLEIS